MNAHFRMLRNALAGIAVVTALAGVAGFATADQEAPAANSAAVATR